MELCRFRNLLSYQEFFIFMAPGVKINSYDIKVTCWQNFIRESLFLMNVQSGENVEIYLLALSSYFIINC